MSRIFTKIADLWSAGLVANNDRSRRKYSRTELDRLDYAGSAPGVRNYYGYGPA